MQPKLSLKPEPIGKNSIAQQGNSTEPIPDNLAFGDSEAILKEGLAAMEPSSPKEEEVPPSLKGKEAFSKEAIQEKAKDNEVKEAVEDDAPPLGGASKGWAKVLKAEKKLQEERSRQDLCPPI